MFGSLGESSLVLLGGVFFLVLSGLVWLPQKVRKWSWHVIWVLLIGALGFDGALMGYQASVYGPVCQLCAIVAAGLGMVLLASAWRTGNRPALVFGLAIWVGVFSGNFILDHAPAGSGADTPSLQEAAITQQACGDRSDHYSLNPKDIDRLATAVSCREIEGDLFNRILQVKWNDFERKRWVPVPCPCKNKKSQGKRSGLF